MHSPPEGLLVSVGQALSRHGLLSDEVIAELGLPTSSGEEAATLVGGSFAGYIPAN